MFERRKGQNKQSQQQRRARLYEEAKERKQADDAIRHSIARKEEDVQMAERKRKAIERSNESSDQRASRLNKMRETAARNRQEETRDQRATSRLKQKRETAEKTGRKRKVIRELPD